MKPLLITSISPSHHNGNAQQQAVQSWLRYTVVAMQHKDEVSAIESAYSTDGVEVRATERTALGLMKAPYVMINAMVDLAASWPSCDAVVLINSDIEIADPSGILDNYIERSADGLIFANRHDHNGDRHNPQRYEHGFDVFIIHRNFFHVLPQSLFCMGQTWWDYWIPFRFIKAGIPVTLVKEPIFLHHRHPVQYNGQEWVRMTKHFQWIEGYGDTLSPQQVNNTVYKLIKQHAR